MLLELAFESPLNELTIERDRDHTHTGNTEYLTANPLSQEVSAKMGPRYAEVAMKCVQCDFGYGFDLEQSKLREGFYRDVIFELVKLEDGMKNT
jgi:hypothetical protein